MVDKLNEEQEGGYKKKLYVTHSKIKPHKKLNSTLTQYYVDVLKYTIRHLSILFGKNTESELVLKPFVSKCPFNS